ncbi:hypothetical protein CPC08DRAFT_97148 [Agrocybe pediades]|nr:hypothetical protein CPC08DRAFT_97148 [Agrocybe pediades]
MKDTTVESHTSDHLLDFAPCAHFFGVIMHDPDGWPESEPSVASVAVPQPTFDAASESAAASPAPETVIDSDGPPSPAPVTDNEEESGQEEEEVPTDIDSEDEAGVDHAKPQVVDGTERASSQQGMAPSAHPLRHRFPLGVHLAPPSGMPIGIVYLWKSTQSNAEDPDPNAPVLRMGYYIAPDYRTDEKISTLLSEKVVKHAFANLSCHRLQLTVLEGKEKYPRGLATALYVILASHCSFPLANLIMV